MKKFAFFIALCLLTIPQTFAVLQEKNLSQTLGVLRAELEQTYNSETSRFLQFEKNNQEQHANLISLMQRSDQIALMLYSQKNDFTFDMAYACQAATEQYRTLRERHLPYDKMKERLNFEIERYGKLIQALRDIPPRLDENGQTRVMQDSVKRKMMASVGKTPFLLGKQGQADRAACLKYAIALRNNYKKMLALIVRDEEHYKHVSKRVQELNDYAMGRYDKIQRNIFINGGENYLTTIQRFRMHYFLAKKDVSDKYRPLKQTSEWRGPVIGGISLFMLFYILLACFASVAVVRWLLPRRLRERFSDKKKLTILNVAFGIAIFAISIMVARIFVKQNFILMAIDLMITFAWLMEAILVSLFIRLNENEILPGIRAYTPFLTMAFVVIIFRIILIPNNLVSLIYPPLLLVFTIWQFIVLRRKIGKLPTSDMVYSIISLVTMIVGCVASWFGFVLLAVQIMIWWTIQLTAIQTITCLYDLAKIYEKKKLGVKLSAMLQGGGKTDAMQVTKRVKNRMAQGEFITNTWLYDLIIKALIPCIAIVSVPFSIYFAAGIFEMSSVCVKIFLYTFLDKPGVIQLSLFKICLVAELFFIFRYINYAARAFFQHIVRVRKKNMHGPSNLTLLNNIISFVVWGIFVIAGFIILQVSSSGISIVMAGLATGLGFAMKGLLENFIYGLSLMTGRLRVGDYIMCDGVEGKVDSINYQSTHIVTIDGSVIAFQNATLFAKNFQNLTRNHGYVRIKIPVGVAYGSSVQNVREILLQNLQRLTGENESGKQVVDMKNGFKIVFASFGDSSVNLEVICWVLAEERIAFVPKVNEVIYNTLNENQVEIPFPQRDVHLYTDKEPKC